MDDKAIEQLKRASRLLSEDLEREIRGGWRLQAMRFLAGAAFTLPGRTKAGSTHAAGSAPRRDLQG